MFSFCSVSLFLFLLFFASTTAYEPKKRRELPLSRTCDPRREGSCHRADLIATKVADCKRQTRNFLNPFTCDPINDFFLSRVVDLPDVDRLGVDCVPQTGLPITCEEEGTNTRCVCYKPVTFINKCRCQYWPAEDVRRDSCSYCTQYDHGGTTGVHFFTCCDNSQDDSRECDGHTYDGASNEDYCEDDGVSNARGGGRPTFRFNCVNCAQQQQCERKCNRNIIARFVPGFCPWWAGCFRRCCIEAENRRNRRDSEEDEDVGDFCGDFICQEGEDHYSCPFDCCAQYNPTDCSFCDASSGATDAASCDICRPLQCCEESNCCISDASGGSGGGYGGRSGRDNGGGGGGGHGARVIRWKYKRDNRWWW